MPVDLRESEKRVGWGPVRLRGKIQGGKNWQSPPPAGTPGLPGVPVRFRCAILGLDRSRARPEGTGGEKIQKNDKVHLRPGHRAAPMFLSAFGAPFSDSLARRAGLFSRSEKTRKKWQSPPPGPRGAFPVRSEGTETGRELPEPPLCLLWRSARLKNVSAEIVPMVRIRTGYQRATPRKSLPEGDLGNTHPRSVDSVIFFRAPGTLRAWTLSFFRLLTPLVPWMCGLCHFFGF